MKKLLMVLFGLAVAAAGLEIYTRVSKRHFMLDVKAREVMYRNADLVMHNVLIPNAAGESVTSEWRVPYRINSWGLRDREYETPKRPGAFRILVIGDSNTEGYGVRIEDTFVKRLEHQINKAAPHADPPKYEVINCGIAGYSPILEYLFLAHKGLALRPDMVLVVYNYSDMRDDFELEHRATFDANGVPLRVHPYKRVRPHGSGMVERFLMRHSRAFLYLDHKLNIYLYNKRFPQYRSAPDVSLFVTFRGSPEETAELWKRNAKYLGMIHDALKEKQVPLMLVTFPDPWEIDANESAALREEYSFGVGQVFDRPPVVAHLKQFCQDRHIPLIDLYDDMKASTVHPMYYNHDAHMNAQGHKVFGAALFRHLAESGTL